MKISIVTAAFNCEDTIGMAIKSVQAQNYRNIEHLIIDGASTDGTLDVCWALADDRTRIVSEPDGGIYEAVNKGLKRARGSVVGLMHADDFFVHDGVLSVIAEAFEDTEIDAVYGDLEYVSGKDPTQVVRRWKAGEFDASSLRNGWMPPHPTLYLRSKVLSRWGMYDTRYEVSADYEAILRWFGNAGITSSYIPQILVRMRVGGESNRSLSRILRKSWEDYSAIRRHGVGHVDVLIRKNMRKITQFL